jgi:transposase InsO family protein/transposase-like protein
MKLHRNARSSPFTRELMVDRVLRQGWTQAAAGEAAGVSRRTVAKWVQRFREGGLTALADGSSRPGPPRHQTPAHTVALLRQLREDHGLPAWALGQALDLPRSTVSAWLRRLGLNRRPAPPPLPVQRYEWPTPGDLIHLDIKALGRFHQAGHRVHGDRQRCSRGAGWEYVHVAVDDHSRLAYVEVLPDQRGDRCAAFLQRAIAWYRARGIVCRRVLTDNGSGYVATAFRQACVALALRHLRTRPYTPRTNGKAERFIQTLLREWAYAMPYTTSQGRRAALRPWVRFYNQQRPHASLGYQPPLTRLQRAA